MRRAVIAVTLVVIAAGCGSDPLTHDEFVTQADEICTEYNDKVTAAFAGITESSSDAEIEPAMEEYVDVYEDMAGEVSDLEPPENDRAIARYVDRLERNARGLREGADHGELMSEAFGNRQHNSTMEARGLAEAAGLEDCAEFGF